MENKNKYFAEILESIDRFNEEYHIGAKDEKEFFNSMPKAKTKKEKLEDPQLEVKEESKSKQSFFVSKKA